MNRNTRTRVAIVGYGNVGSGALDAIEMAADLEVAGIVVREHAIERTRNRLCSAVPIVTEISHLGQVDVAVLAVPSRSVAEVAAPLLRRGINTVDSFDIHGEALWQLRQQLSEIALEAGVTAIVAAGWDPGSDSLIRAIFALQSPQGISYTNFGPGMSMGHTVAVKKIVGVKDALSLTLPLGHGLHRRQVYVELLPGYELAEVATAIQQDPYFIHDPTQVEEVSSVTSMQDTGHGVVLERHGTAGRTANQVFRYESRVTNPAVTGQVMVSSARAAQRMQPGAYTMLEVPLIHFLSGDLRTNIEQFV